MNRHFILILLFSLPADASPDLARQIREQERQIQLLEIEVAQLRWELEREKTKNSGAAMLLPELSGKDTPAFSPGPPQKMPFKPRFHTVRKGENLYRISLKYGLTLQQLQAANPKVDPLKLRIGQKLRLSTGSSETANHKF